MHVTNSTLKKGAGGIFTQLIILEFLEILSNKPNFAFY